MSVSDLMACCEYIYFNFYTTVVITFSACGVFTSSIQAKKLKQDH